MQEAVEAYHKEQEAPIGTKPQGLRKVAEKFQVAWRTLANLVNGGQSASEASASRQKVTPTEERVLTNFIKDSADIGFPLDHRTIEVFANAIVHARVGSEYKPVGHTWIYNFITRHRDELQSHWSHPLDTQRARSLNPDVVKHWFYLVKQWIVDNEWHSAGGYLRYG